MIKYVLLMGQTNLEITAFNYKVQLKEASFFSW